MLETSDTQTRRSMQLAVDASPNAMVLVDSAGIMVMVNASIATLFGYQTQELIGQAIELLVPMRFSKSHSQLRHDYSLAPSTRAMGHGRELYGLHKTGKEIPVEIGLNHLHSDMGTMILASVVDISERRAQDEQLRAALREKEVLLSEIHHRVKNNLQIIDSLIGLQSETVTGERVLAAFQDSQNRIRSIAMIHQILYESQDFSKVAFQSVLENLIDNLTQSYGVDISRIKIVFEVNEVNLPLDKGIPLCLIINELVSNAFKHAFPNGMSGVLRLGLKQTQEKQLEFSIEDSGIGLAESFMLRDSNSLGLHLVRTIVDQLGGSLEIHRSNPTRFAISFPEFLES